MLYRLSFNAGLAETLGPGESGTPYLCAGHVTTPRYGFCWWFWLPTLHYNGARLDRHEVLDLSLSWLCCWCTVTAWPKQDGTLKPWFHSALAELKTARPHRREQGAAQKAARNRGEFSKPAPGADWAPTGEVRRRQA